MSRGRDRKRKSAERLAAAEQRRESRLAKTYHQDPMGLFQEYIAKGLPPQQLDDERKKMLVEIGKQRNTSVISYCARVGIVPQGIDIGVAYEDILPFADSLQGLTGNRVSVILETPGGIGEVGRQLVEMLHQQFNWVEFIVPGMAMSTGTIMCLGGHDILMGPASALGPIDAQLQQDGKRFSADAFIEGFENIKKEVMAAGGKLNPAFIPILQRISPGELQNAHNALEFARATVTQWLIKYKFGTWEKNGVPVDPEVKKQRAREIAENLARQSNWHTHGRSLRIPDLEALGLKITDFSKDKALNDAIQRFHVLTRLAFDAGQVYKLYETGASTIAKRFNIPAAMSPQQAANVMQGLQKIDTAQVDVRCNRCGTVQPMQLDFTPGQALQPGRTRFPNVAKKPCPKCGAELGFASIRAGIEKQVGRQALSPQPS